MQPTVEMIQDNYTTSKIPNMNYITVVTHLMHTHMHTHIHSNNTNNNNTNNTNDNSIRSNLKLI